MSDSRLEKFIHAICSMDVSDLPVPLSRIEKLWNCLITGETPDFEPLSRNEKYLMAMLDRYDISNLPAPMSRGEKLLYKIAIGETDLSDVPGYLSRYEELLKYLIENGGISGDDFEYVLYTFNQSLYTLYTTAEKPVKSAILKGQTLVNLAGKPKSVFCSNGIDMTFIYDKTSYVNRSLTVKPNTTYTIFNFNDKKISSLGLYSEDNRYITELTLNGNSVIKHTTSSDTFIMNFLCRNTEGWTEEELLNGSNIVLIEGDYTNVDIPYFEGMQSVKMPVLTTTGGKNLMSSSLRYDVFLDENGLESTRYQDIVSKEFIQVESSTSYGITTFYQGEMLKPQNTFICEYDNGKNFIKRFNTLSGIFATDINTKYIKFSIGGTGIPGNIEERKKIFIELEKTKIKPTAYEPHKSNILTVNEDVVLRGIGDVKDTLDISTGEKVERIGEIVLDGSENWLIVPTDKENTMVFYINNGNLNLKLNGHIISDKFPTILTSFMTYDDEGIRLTSDIYINILKTRLSTQDINGFKQWLSQNPLTVKYELATESIKTVDLTVVDQDNQPTKLGTFENVTHVSLESAGLIPEVEMEVATHISEELASASPLMDDISTKQEQLNTMVDEQSNNVDATMMATTEIYEETL